MTKILLTLIVLTLCIGANAQTVGCPRSVRISRELHTLYPPCFYTKVIKIGAEQVEFRVFFTWVEQHMRKCGYSSFAYCPEYFKTKVNLPEKEWTLAQLIDFIKVSSKHEAIFSGHIVILVKI